MSHSSCGHVPGTPEILNFVDYVIGLTVRRRDADSSEESRFGKACEGRGRDGGYNSSAVYNKEGKIMGAEAGGQCLSCFIILPRARSSGMYSLTFYLHKLMPGASTTSFSISHISEVTLSFPRADKSVLAQMALSMVLLGKVLTSCAKESDFKLQIYVSVIIYPASNSKK